MQKPVRYRNVTTVIEGQRPSVRPIDMTERKLSKRATLKTVAELTGLSLSTVSLSLRDGSNVSSKTRHKVAEAAKMVGYVPNRAGVRLRTGRTNVLSLVLNTDNNSVDFTRILIQGICDQIEGTRYHLNVVPDSGATDPIRSVEYILENRTSDGIILTHTKARDPRVQYLLDADFPFVCHGRTEFYTPHAFHDLNVEKLVEIAVARLVAQGRKKLLLATLDNGTSIFASTVTTFDRNIAKAGVEGTVVSDANSLGSAAQSRLFGRNLTQHHGGVDGIICIDELTALALISGRQETGGLLGREFDLICRQTTEILPTIYPNIDTLSEDLFSTGRELAELLVKVMAGEPSADLQTLHEPKIRWRKT